MASEKDFNLLDDYIGNRLEGVEKEAFEAKLKIDSDLNAEFKIQHQIVESIRKARMSELKAKLNNIPASAIPPEGTSTVRWIGAASAVIVAAGLYFYLKPASTDSPISPKDTIRTETPAPATPKANVPDTQVTKDTQDPIDVEKVPAIKQNTKEKAATKPEVERSAEPAVAPDIDVYDPSGENTEPSGADENVPSERKPQQKSKSEIPTEVNSTSKTYTFHYQFKNEKLTLFGPFDKNIYEIMEFFADNRRTMFLFFNNNYYLLNQDGDKVKPLSPVNDPALLQKLKEYRNAE